MAEETVPATTPPQEPAPEAQPAPVPDPAEEVARLRSENARLAGGYTSLQRKYDDVYRRAEASTALMDEVASNLRFVRESQSALTKATLGEDQAKALDAQFTQATAQTQQKQAAQQAMEFIESQTRLMTEALQAAGVDTNLIQWPQDARSVQEWHERSRTAVNQAVGASREKYIKAVETANAKAKEQAKTDAEKIADKTLKEAGVGRIDNSRGSGTSMRDRIAAMDPTGKDFNEMIQQAKAGKLTKI